MSKIPKIIHQIWGGDKPLPEHLIDLSNSWKQYNPEWEYRLWTDSDIDVLVQEYYPHYYERFKDFSYNMQRWDTVRYMILYLYGGVYTDFDTECFKPLDKLIEGKECFFSLESFESARINNKEFQLATAIMGSAKGFDFMNEVLLNIFENFKKLKFTHMHKKVMDVVASTGPLMLTNVYEKCCYKERISVIPHTDLAFFDHYETMSYLTDRLSEEKMKELEERIIGVFAVHYYFYDWFMADNNQKKSI